MPFEKGNTEGAKSRKQKPFSDALLIAINEAATDGDGKKMRQVADALVQEAIKGNVQAIKEVADRLDGKVLQQVAGPDDDEGFPTEITFRIV